MRYFLPKIKYLGQIIEEKDRRSDSSHANAIKNMPIPTNVSSLQSFLGKLIIIAINTKYAHTLRAP